VIPVWQVVGSLLVFAALICFCAYLMVRISSVVMRQHLDEIDCRVNERRWR